MNVREYLNENYDELVLLDGHDNAIIGVGGAGGQTAVIYDRTVIIKNLESMGMSNAEAVEYLVFNIAGTTIESHTPIIVDEMLPAAKKYYC